MTKFTDGELYQAEVILASKSKTRKKAPVKVHYTGFIDDEDAWVAVDDLVIPRKPSVPPPPHTHRSYVQACY